MMKRLVLSRPIEEGMEIKLSQKDQNHSKFKKIERGME